jgi:hypothetical protein
MALSHGHYLFFEIYGRLWTCLEEKLVRKEDLNKRTKHLY